MHDGFMAYPGRATHFQARHPRPRGVRRRGDQRDHVDRPIETDADKFVLRPESRAVHRLTLLELDGDAGARLDGRVSADQHAADRYVADEAELTPVADDQ